MEPGRLRHRGRLEQMTETTDQGGGRVEGWATVHNVRCDVEGLGGNEQLRAMSAGVTQPHRVTMRYRPGVTAAMRFVEEHPDGDRIHNITSVRDVEGRRAELELLTEWQP